MGNYNKRGGGNRRGRSNGGNRGWGDNQMHQAVCSDCGNDCEVPFKPSGDKPIYCSDCFADKRAGGNKFNRGRDKGKSSGKKEMFPGVCKSCGEECLLPFRPSSSRPVFCSACFDQQDNGKRGVNRGGSAGGNSDVRLLEQLSRLNDNLEEIISLMLDDEPDMMENEEWIGQIDKNEAIKAKPQTEKKSDKKGKSNKKAPKKKAAKKKTAKKKSTKKKKKK